jgi:ABC-type branched-subunit amino acid transport system permease subunit
VKQSWVGGGSTSLLQGTVAKRPQLFETDKAFLVLAIIVCVVMALAVAQLRSGTFGKTLLALRGSEIAARSIGISPARSRLIAFAISGFIAGIGGALLAMHQENVNYGNNFTPFGSMFWVVITVVVGTRTVEGALNAGASFSLFDAVVLKGAIVGWILRDLDKSDFLFFPVSGQWVFILFGLGAIQFARHPEGILEFQAQQRLLRAEKRRSKKEQKSLAANAQTPDEDRTAERVS